VSERTAGRIANVVAIATLLLLLVSSFPPLRRESSGDPGDTGYIIGIIVGLGIYVAIGRAIVRRDAGNTIGWLLLLIPLLTAFSLAVGVYATTALVDRPGELPLGIWAAWLDRWLLPTVLSSFIYIFLLYPDGHLPSPRWRPALVLTVVATAITAVSFALTPGRMTGSQAHLETVHVNNPLGVSGLSGLVDALTVVGSVGLLVSAVLAGAALVVRYRGAPPDTRQQIRWLRFVGVTFLVVLALMIVFGAAGASDLVGNILFTLMFATLALGIPAACGVAILKYRLYDLDIVVRKTVVLAIVAGAITIVYAVVAVGIPLAIRGVGSNSGFDAIPLVAAAVVALVFDPVRRRARRLADRLVLGERATPYEVLSSFGERVGDTYATDDVLPRMARLLSQGTGADATTVWLRVAGELRPEASWPSELVRGSLPAPGETLPPFPDEDAFEIRDQGEVLGAITLRMPASDPMDPSKSKLVRDLAAQAGLVLRNVRLIEDLRASRQRLVAAQDEERRRIERNIHDGAQQQLVALAVQLKLARTMVDRDPAKAGPMLDGLQAAATTALEDLRDLARGIYPPLLADQGLTAALEAQARKAALPVTVSSEGVGRYPQEIEAAVYFCSLEALNNVAKYAGASAAEVRLAQENGHLSFTVHDDGAGFDPDVTGYGTGLHGMADRLDAIGGNLTVESAPGSGTFVRGWVPVATGAAS
jgi:signal transduction histidine kinase